MMRRPLLALVLAASLLASAAPALAQAPGAYARLGFGARGVGMGGALVADVFGAASPYYNPALAPRVGRQALEASAALLAHERSLQHLQFAFPLPPSAGAAVGVLRAGVDGIDGRDASGYHTGELSTQEYVLFAAFGIRMGRRVSGGLGLRFYHADLAEAVEPVVSLALSAGLAAQLSERLALGLAVDDLLARYSWDTSDAFGEGGKQTVDRFPVRFRLGGAYALAEGRGTITAELEAQLRTAERRSRSVIESEGVPQVRTNTERLRISETRLRLGGELWLAEPFAVRAGLDRVGPSGFSGAAPAAGFALRQRLGDLTARLDYTAVLEPYGAGLAHFIALQLDL